MREQYEKYLEGTLDIAAIPQDEDPFWDPNEPMNIGYSTVFLKPLAYCMPIKDDYAIYYETQQEGIMHVEIEPCKPDGSPINEDEDDGPYDDIESAADLKGRRLDILVTISYARGLNKKYSSEVFIEFDLPQAPNQQRDDGRYQTTAMQGTTNPTFSYKQHVTWHDVDEQLIFHFENGNAYFYVWGLQEDKSGQSTVHKRKMLTMAEVEELQHELKKVNDARTKELEIVQKIQDTTVKAARGNEAAEGYVLEIANLLAEMGLDVEGLIEAANSASKQMLPPTVTATESSAVSSSADSAAISAAKDAAEKKAADLQKELDQSKAKITELESAKGGGEADTKPLTDEIATLKDKIKTLESAAPAAAPAPAASGGGEDVAKTKQELESVQAELAKKTEREKELEQQKSDLEKKLEEEKKKASDTEGDLKAKLAAAEKATPGGGGGGGSDNKEQIEKLEKQIEKLDKEKEDLRKEKDEYKEKYLKLQGQFDLQKAQLETSNKQGSKGCVVQ
mmetsp:Transcript_26158/g.40941  ORF Transcript_26158/g.40941 Transcript_26158/m.40941 type:complete len:507 (+) Transcript_26158:2-1522(+)